MSNTNLLSYLQKNLKAPKGQYNSFGKYKYRSCEDIVEAVKKIMPDKASLVLSDEIVEVGGRVYLKATATLSAEDGYEKSSTAYAREPETKKGMDESQVTGTASSYARKYALNGLFAIDDTKDADTMDNRPETKPQPQNSYDGNDPGEYVFPAGFLKGERLKNVDNGKLQEQLLYWSEKGKGPKKDEIVAALKNYLNEAG